MTASPDFFVACPKGHEIAVSPFQEGMSLPCPKCGALVTVTDESIQERAVSPPVQAPPPVQGATPLSPSPGPAPGAPSELSAPQGPVVCDRCGKPFRGPWDRLNTTAGVLCNICANYIGSGAKRITEERGPKPVDTTLLDSKVNLKPDREPSRFDEIMRKVALISGGAVVVLALFFWLIGEQSNIPEPGPAAQQETAAEGFPEVTVGGGIVLIGLMAVFGIAPQWLALYLVLMWSERLPNDTFAANALVLLLYAVAINLLGLIPCFGLILTIYILWAHFDLNISELMLYAVVNIIATVLMWSVSLFVYAGFARLLGY
ncbi:MAG: hypothetical protein KJ052_12575 [Candidatus Hydrogenedentes bacterium]|nr:hypothetical protein [Candidatus Hydrogenedentota bacterium]